jgi:hypothetical protein
MSVIVLAKFRGDPDKFESVIRSRPAMFEALAAEAKRNGALHHRIAARDGEVIAIDEWQTADAYNVIYPDKPSVIEFLQDAGLEEPPEVDYYFPITVPGEF